MITDAPEATVVPETSEEEASSPEAQSESPLAQPESPLGQPDSPLTTASNGTPRNEEEALALAANTRAQEPSEGLGSLSGVLYSFGNVPGAIRGTQVYLEAADEVDGEFFPPSVSLGPSVDAGDIIVETNGVGQLQMEVPPGNYYMAVWTPYNWLLVVSEPDEESPRLITVEEGDQIDLGVLYVDWP